MTEENSNVEINSLVVVTTVPGFMECAEIISRLRQKYHGKEYDVTTPVGMKEAIDARAELRAIRIRLDKEKPKVKEDARKFLDSVEQEYKAIRGAICEYEDIPDAAIHAEKERKEAAELAKAKAEEDRRALILDNVNRISAIPSTAVGLDSKGLQDLIEKTVSLPITGPDFQEFLSKAISVRDDALRQLREMLLKVAEQERVAAEQAAENERIRLEQEEIAAKLKAAQEKMEAEKAIRDKEENDRRAEEKKRLDEESARIKAEREKFEAEQEEIRKRAAERQAEIDRTQREAGAKLQAERDTFEKQQAEAARIAQEKADKEAAELAEAQRLQAEKDAAERKAAEEKAAAEKAEADRIEQEKRDAESAALKAAFEEKVKDINYAMGYIYQLALEAQENPLPFDLIKQIVEIAGKFIQEDNNEVHKSGKSPSKRVQSAGKK